MRKYILLEHTPMGDRNTEIKIDSKDVLNGTATVDVGPGKRIEVKLEELNFMDDGLTFLIVAEELPRRYYLYYKNGKEVVGKVVFEGESELSGIETPFDGKEE